MKAKLLVNLRPLLSTVVLLPFFCGCEGYATASGTVRDKSTLQPIDSADVKVLSGDMEVFTDSAGAFEVHNPFGGCMPCKDITIEVSKQGFKSQKLINPGNSDILLDSL